MWGSLGQIHKTCTSCTINFLQKTTTTKARKGARCELTTFVVGAGSTGYHRLRPEYLHAAVLLAEALTKAKCGSLVSMFYSESYDIHVYDMFLVTNGQITSVCTKQ